MFIFVSYHFPIMVFWYMFFLGFLSLSHYGFLVYVFWFLVTFPLWFSGSDVVLDCIDFWFLPSFLLCFLVNMGQGLMNDSYNEQ